MRGMVSLRNRIFEYEGHGKGTDINWHGEKESELDAVGLMVDDPKRLFQDGAVLSGNSRWAAQRR